MDAAADAPAADAGATMDDAADEPATPAPAATGDGETPAADSSMEVEAGSVGGDGVPAPAASPIAAAPPPAAAAAAPAPAASAISPESMAQLTAMGFSNEAQNRQALEAAQGDVGLALTFLMGGP